MKRPEKPTIKEVLKLCFLSKLRTIILEGPNPRKANMPLTSASIANPFRLYNEYIIVVIAAYEIMATK